MDDNPDAMIEVSAQWKNEELTEIYIETDSKFAYNLTNADYAVALLLTNDGLQGSGINWSQANYYNTGSGDPYMSDWFGAGSYVSGLTYNFVAVAAWNIENGFDGSVPTSVTGGESNKFSYIADISSKSVIQDKSLLKVIALLINRSTGEIINAGHTRIKAFDDAMPGDVDVDGSVNIGDVTTLIDYLLSGNASGISLSGADYDQDGSVSISDVTALIDYLLNGVQDIKQSQVISLNSN